MILNLEELQKVNEDRDMIQMGSNEVSQEHKKHHKDSISKNKLTENFPDRLQVHRITVR